MSALPKASFQAAVILLVAFSGTYAPARNCRVNLVPNGSVSNCLTCHTSANGGSRNSFGRAVQTAINNSSNCNAACWSVALAQADSDSDGVTNGAELQDPDGTWRPGMPNPGNRALVTNPGVANPPPRKKFVRGDFNSDGKVNVTDAVRVLVLLFAAGAEAACKSAPDFNNDGKVDVADAVLLLQFLFQKGPAPPAPFPACATGTARLGCTASPGCP